MGFKPPKYRSNKGGHYVEYYAEDPVDRVLKRKRIKLNHIEDRATRDRYARKLVRDLMDKLMDGWNPWKEQENPLGYYTMKECIHRFMANKQDLRPDSLRSYTSFMNYFVAYLKEKNRFEDYASNFTVRDASDIMNTLLTRKKLGASTYNNYLQFLRTFSNWMMGNGYFKANPFEGIQKKKKSAVKKQFISYEDRKRIEPWLKANYPAVFWASQLMFYCMIRPTEICFLTPAHFDFDAQTLELRPEETKSGRYDLVTIPDDFIDECYQFVKSSGAQLNEYIISDNYRPGKNLFKPRRFGKVWNKVRKQFNLPVEMKFYCYKNSGIISMLEQGISPDIVMRQARHTELTQTTVYLKLIRKDANEYIKKFKDV